MDNKLLLSLCIPTNGVLEWVSVVLDSIYSQGEDNSKFEVVVTDNGDNIEFFDWMTEYASKHSNLRYIKTKSYLFLNEIDSYKNANGLFIKFLNHRTVMLPGALGKLLSFVENNINSKPIVYFSNGVLKFKGEVECKNFDEYVNKLSYWSSWSTGMAFWKDDFDNIKQNIIYNELFPHTTILFNETKKEKYIINNEKLLDELPTKGIAKGSYDLFFAFAVEYVSIILDLVRKGSISTQTFLKVKNDNLSFIATLYIDFVVRKKKCSYDLSSLKTSIKCFYSMKNLRSRSFIIFNKKIIRKLFRRN